MPLIKFAPLAVLPALLSCSDVGGGTGHSGGAIPRDLTLMCIGTVSSDAKNSAVNVSLKEFIAIMAKNGFVASWSGSSTVGVLTLRKDDQFAGKSTEFAFETEQRPYAGSITTCQPAIAVMVRAKLDGELLSAFASEDAALTIAQQAQRARPATASTPAAPPVEPDLEGPPAELSPNAPTDEVLDPDADEQEIYENAVAPTLDPSEYPPNNAM